jgi:threonylcarbamoyladenosine tRNA methylthiotransferase CDKAL1
MPKVEIETYGCAMNQADSEFMAGLLEREGFEIREGGDVLVVNTCTVKTPTERKILKRLRGLENSGRRVVVTGCMPSSQPDTVKKFPDFSFLGLNLEDVPLAVRKEIQGGRFIKIQGGECRLKFPRVRKNPAVGILPIAQGCVGRCSFCITRKARGRLSSYPAEMILADVKKALAEGVREIWLTAQDTGAYGLDTGENLPSLMKRVSEIPGGFKVRIGMMNPNHALKFLDRLIPAYRNEKIYKFLHIPVQSGDNQVLGDMGRQYRTGEFKKVVRKFRKNFPSVTISTDVILGFPTESEQQFQKTRALIEEIKPEVLNISRFWLRPGTGAGKLKQLPTRISKDRSRLINEIFRKYAREKNRAWIGQEEEALVSGKGRKGGWIARNSAYKPIVIATEENLLGKFIRVRIKDATFYDLRGEIKDAPVI